MWERAFLKQNAKLVLNTNYWMAFAVSLVAGFLVGGSSGGGGAGTTATNLTSGNYSGFASQIDSFISAIGLGVIVSVISVAALMGIAYSVFVANPISVGKTRYYVRSRAEVSRFTLLFSSFKTTRIQAL